MSRHWKGPVKLLRAKNFVRHFCYAISRKEVKEKEKLYQFSWIPEESKKVWFERESCDHFHCELKRGIAKQYVMKWQREMSIVEAKGKMKKELMKIKKYKKRIEL